MDIRERLPVGSPLKSDPLFRKGHRVRLVRKGISPKRDERTPESVAAAYAAAAEKARLATSAVEERWANDTRAQGLTVRAVERATRGVSREEKGTCAHSRARAILDVAHERRNRAAMSLLTRKVDLPRLKSLIDPTPAPMRVAAKAA